MVIKKQFKLIPILFVPRDAIYHVIIYKRLIYKLFNKSYEVIIFKVKFYKELNHFNLSNIKIQQLPI